VFRRYRANTRFAPTRYNGVTEILPVVPKPEAPASSSGNMWNKTELLCYVGVINRAYGIV